MLIKMVFSKIVSVVILSTLLIGCSIDETAGKTAIPISASALSIAFNPTKAFHFTWTDVVDANYYELHEDSTGSSGYTLVKGNIPTVNGANSFDHFAPLHGRLNAKYILKSCNAGGCATSEAIYISTRVPEMVNAIINLERPDDENLQGDALFGYSVTISADGNTLATGAYFETNPDEDGVPVAEAGSVSVYSRTNNIWTRQARLTNVQYDDRGDRFGYSLNLSADGNSLAVAATRESGTGVGVSDESEAKNVDNGSTASAGTGAVFLYSRTGLTWKQQAYIKDSNPEPFGNFGTFVKLSKDGTTLAVGAQWSDSSVTGINSSVTPNRDAQNSGSAYVFVRDGSTWTQQAYLKPKVVDAGDNFGVGMSMSTDGNTLAIAGWWEDSNAKGINGDEANNDAVDSGAAYVFVRNGSTWTQQAYLKASNSEAGDRFGTMVTISADGNTLAVSSWWEDSNATGINPIETDNSVDAAGAVYVFTRSGTTWTQQAYLKSSNTDAGDLFGSSMTISADGNTLVVTAQEENSDAKGINGDQTNNSAVNSGAAYVFVRDGLTWSQSAYLKASDTAANAKFGAGLSINADASTLAIGANGVGKLYIY